MTPREGYGAASKLEGEAGVSEAHQARTTSTESDMREQRVEEDLQDQMQELRREINELRVVVYALLAAGFIAIFMAGGLSFGQAVVALAGCFVAFAAYGWAREKIVDWRAG